MENVNKLFHTWDRYLALSDYSKHLLSKCCGVRVIDLLLHFPSSILERTDDLQKVLSARNSDKTVGRMPFLNVVAKIIDYEIPSSKLRPLKVICETELGELHVVYFNWKLNYIKKILPIGSNVALSGAVQMFNSVIQMSHPDRTLLNGSIKYWNCIEPIYPTIANLSSSFIALQIKKLLKFVDEIDEWLPQNVLEKFGWDSFIKSIYKIHNPESYEDVSEFSKGRERIAFDEILANQICLNIVRKKVLDLKGQSFYKNEELLKRISLPFELTDDQKNVLKEIYKDLESETPMNRLVQGDVGSGKTIVAFLAMLNVISGGAQVAFIAPTEILAIQHYENIKALTNKLNINVDIIIAKNRKYRESQIKCLEHGLTKIAIGTHALLEDNIKFQNLGMVVIDEQQRFGVMQRLKLIEKGACVNALYLSATPIPRTLVLSIFGDLDVSVIKTKPKYRQKIDTVVIDKKRINDIISRIKSYDGQVYWICPLIEESDIKKVANVIERYDYIKEKIGSVGLLHGKLKSTEKEQVLNDFKDNKFKVLVSTTVVEVGIDVPNANIIVIENAENFGLAQLHQLRGRVGRGTEKAYCVLLYGHPISKDGIERLNILKQTDDGFELSEADMKMRGYGNILGTKQSGFQSFKFCDITAHQDLLAFANDLALKCLNSEENEVNIRNRNLLLDIYGKEDYSVLM